MILQKGQGVTHKTLGRGFVLSNRHGGFEYLVAFGSLRVWVKEQDLNADDTGLFLIDSGTGKNISAESIIDSIIKKEPILGHRPVMQPGFREEYRNCGDMTLIESFRMGIVPDCMVADWTEGRKDELREIKSWLSDESEGALIIEGPYGSGKSHLLCYLRGTAVMDGWAVSLAHFDPSEATAAFPKKLYRKITSNFSMAADGKILDFRSFLEEISVNVIKNIGSNPVSDHRFFGHLINGIIRNNVREDVWDWICGREGVRGEYGSLYDFTTVANVYCNILSCLGFLIATRMNNRGLLLLFDEVETSRSMFYNYQFDRGLNFFRGLSLMANDDPVLLEDVPVRIDNVRKGDKTGLVYSGHLPIPYIFRVPSHVKVVFVMTPNSLTQEFREFRSSIPSIMLDSLKVEDLQAIFKRFVEHYCRIHNVSHRKINLGRVFRQLLERSGYQSTRHFIKSMVEFMDFLRFYPSLNAEEVLFH